jgi:hypothetical protein
VQGFHHPQGDGLREAQPGNESREARRLTVREFLKSLDFSDLLVVLGFALAVTAGWSLHPAAGLAILGGGLILVGVRSGSMR